MSAPSSKSTSNPFINASTRIQKQSGKKGIFGQEYPTRSQFIIDQSASDDRHPGISIPAETFTASRSQHVEHIPGDEDVGNPSKRRRVEDTDARRGVTSIVPPTIDYSPMEAEDLDIPSIPLVTLEHPSIDREDRSVQSRDGADLDCPIPIEATTVAVEACSVTRRDGDPEIEEVPSMALLQGASNFQIDHTNFITSGRDVTIIQFGDGQFTDAQRILICDHIANLTILPDINDNLKRHALTQSTISLPRAEAVFNDYQTKKKSGPCFEGTRVALLREMADWLTGPDESRMYVLSGLAGIGKSTVAYTIASRAAGLNLLGASFFFSRDEADRNNAKRFFSTIAYQLCVYNETFSKAIGDVLLTERGSAATTKGPQEQLQALILDPLRSIVQSRARPILVVVDALDECDEEDESAVVMGLSQLVRLLPSFKVILTTRPQPLVDYLFDNHDGHKIFHLQDIEDKVVDGDIRLYLSHSFSHEQVKARLLNPRVDWCASDEDIESLVKAAGRLFIFASTAVLHVLNRALGDPGARMKRLLEEIALDRTPFHALNHFYSVIVRGAVQVNSGDDDNDDIVDRYQIVVGTILTIQTPLPVTTLAYFIGEEPEKIYAMLRNLQSVILLGSDDVPRMYHKSFSDHLTDKACCKDPRLRIDLRICHTQIGTRCFQIMDKHLKRNILGLGDPARFMDNEDGLRKDGITYEQLQEKIPQQLHYSCVYWVNHFEIADIEDDDLMNGLEKLAHEHLLHWFEVLSLIGKLDLAHRAIRTVLKLLKSTSSDLHQLFSEVLRFISQFYQTIKRAALHTYHSALPFTPRNSLLYCRYIHEAVHNICSIEGGPEKWDGLIANLDHGNWVDVVKFSLDGALFLSYTDKGILNIWDATTGTPISTIQGDRFAIANDFSTVVSSEDNTITYYNMKECRRGTMFTTPSEIKELAFSSENSRIAAALSDGTVCLWDSRNAKLIDSFDGYWPWHGSHPASKNLVFSPTGTRLVYLSMNGIAKLRYGTTGRPIADLRCGSDDTYFTFSHDGSRIAFMSSDCGLTLWDSENGWLIGANRAVRNVNYRNELAISANGSLLAIVDDGIVKLWCGNHGSFAQINVLQLEWGCMAFSLDNILAITNLVSGAYGVDFYNVNTHSFISRLSFGALINPTAMAFSPDSTRLVVGDANKNVHLCDIRGIDTSGPPLKAKATRLSALALSRDCSRLACGFSGGTVELWGTNPSRRLIASRQACTGTGWIRALAFGPDGRVFASGSVLGTIKLWNGRDGALLGTCKFTAAELFAVALSNSMLVAAGESSVTLWCLHRLNPIHTFEALHLNRIRSLSISDDNELVAINSFNDTISLFDMIGRTTIVTFDAPYNAQRMTFLPDNSQLVVQTFSGDFVSFDLINKSIKNGPTLDHLIQLPNTPLWHGVPIWYRNDPPHSEQQYCAALFSQHTSPVPVLWIPRELHVNKMIYAQGSSMIALDCEAEGVILLQLSTSDAN